MGFLFKPVGYPLWGGRSIILPASNSFRRFAEDRSGVGVGVDGKRKACFLMTRSRRFVLPVAVAVRLEGGVAP